MTFGLPWVFGAAGAPPLTGEAEEATDKSTLSKLLQHYASPDLLPPSARMDPSLKQRDARPIPIYEMWKYGAFAATKGT